MNEPISAEENRQKIKKIIEENDKKQQSSNKRLADAEILIDYCEQDDLPQPQIFSDDNEIDMEWKLDWTITIGRDENTDLVAFYAFCGDNSQTIHCEFLTIVYAYRLLKLFILHICYDE